MATSAPIRKSSRRSCSSRVSRRVMVSNRRAGRFRSMGAPQRTSDVARSDSYHVPHRPGKTPPIPLARMISLCYRIDVTPNEGEADMTQERVARPVSGSVGLTVAILLMLSGITLFIQSVQSPHPLAGALLAVLALGLGVLSVAGLFTAEPNQAVV